MFEKKSQVAALGIMEVKAFFYLIIDKPDELLNNNGYFIL
jgi:hypothetical protein